MHMNTDTNVIIISPHQLNSFGWSVCKNLKYTSELFRSLASPSKAASTDIHTHTHKHIRTCVS